MKPTQQEIQEAYLQDLQKEVAQLEGVKRSVEGMRTENWTLEKRNNELKVKIEEISRKENNLKIKEEELNLKEKNLSQRESSVVNEREILYSGQIKLSKDIQEFNLEKGEFDKKAKDLSDKERSIEAREYEVEIKNGKLEQKLKAYRDKLSI